MSAKVIQVGPAAKKVKLSCRMNYPERIMEHSDERLHIWEGEVPHPGSEK